MTPRKHEFIYLLIIPFFFILSARLYAASEGLNSLSLDFTKIEKVVLYNPDSQEEQLFQNTLKGKILYNKSPFYFVFQTESDQTILLNDKGCFALTKEKPADRNTEFSFIDITNQAQAINQLFNDFLNWFKQDYGLRESGYFPELVWLENERTASSWSFKGKGTQAIDKVIAFSDEFGRLTELNMYISQKDENGEARELLLTTTKLSDFDFRQGNFYPKRISSVSYGNQKTLLTTELTFENVSFYQAQEPAYIQEEVLKVPQASVDLSWSRQINQPQSPQAQSYWVSIPSVLAGASFKLYKSFITGQDLTNCPFSPSCSQYMLQAISQNGLFGFFQGLERLKRCTSTEHKRNLYPVLSNGKHYDPVPAKKEKGKSE